MPGLIILLQALMLAVSGPPTSPEYLPIRVAEAEGYFAAEGLAVTVRTTRAESGAAEALAQGQADLAATTLEAILRFGLRATSTPSPRLIFGLTAAPPVALLVAGPHASAVRSIEDLSAMRVGVSTPGAPEHAWFGWLLARSGLSIAQVRVRSLGERGLVAAIDSGDVHVALVPEPMASQLLSQGRAKLLADFRTPRAAATTLGSSTVNAAVFTRADRRAPDRDLASLIRALKKAEQRIQAAEARDLAGRLPTRVVGDFADFEARLTASHGLYLPDGQVSADQLQQTIAIIRAHTPLPQSVKIPKPEDMLLQIKSSAR
jgi:NitT/TauT family transport system substrate-binding protein